MEGQDGVESERSRVCQEQEGPSVDSRSGLGLEQGAKVDGPLGTAPGSKHSPSGGT